MTFRIELLVKGELPAVLRTPELEVRLDELMSPNDEPIHVLSAQCRALAATGGVSFLVAGFGQDRWPVDVETDLAVALEQLPGVLAGLRNVGEPFQFNFYEQGIERYIAGTRHGDDVSFECMSMSLRWTADPRIETMRLTEAENLFRELRDRCLATIERVCPWLAEVPAFERWQLDIAAAAEVLPSAGRRSE